MTVSVAVVAIFFTYVLLQVDDVSAQTSCVISPNMVTLTIADGLVRDVEFHCQCMDDNGMLITGTRWLLSNGNAAPAPTQNFNITPAVLLIARLFDSNDAGTYICSPNNNQNDPSRDIIALSTGTPTGNLRICNIYSPSLTTDGGVMSIANGTENVILYCICRRTNVAVGPGWWLINGTEVTRTTASGNNPYLRDNVPAPLIIPSFTASHVGTYTCTSDDFSETIDTATIDLALPVEPPTNVRATVLTPRSVEVTWTISSSPDVTGYLISYTTTAEYASGGNITVNGGSTTSGTLTDLEENTLYIITLQATVSNSRSGNIVVSVTTYTDVPSSPPHNVMVTSVNPASLMVSWQPPPLIDHNGQITVFVIQYTRVESSDTMSEVVTSGTTRTLSGLVAYVDYSVIVAAVNVNGTGPFSNPPVVERSGEDVPSEPQSLEIVSVNSSSVTLQWSPPVTLNGIITQYSIQFNATVINNFGNNMLNMLTGTVEGLSPETVYVLQVRAHTGVGAGPPSNITIITSPGPISNVIVRDDSVTSSTLTLTWMEISLTNSNFSHYAVFYLPVRDPYGPIMASNRRKRQSAQAGELTMNFTGTTGILTNLYGAVTYRIQVAGVTILNGQEIIGDRSVAVEITTSEGVPTAPHNLSYTYLTGTGVTLTWRRPDPPNGLITQYNVSYSVAKSQCEILYNFTILQEDNIVLSYTWTDLIQGRYQFSVVAFTRVGAGEVASLMLSTLPNNEISSDDGSNDNSGAVIAFATLFAIAVVGLVISVVINVFLVMKLKQSRYDVNQSNVRYSDVKQSVSRDKSITDSTSKYIKPSEPEYEAIDTKPNMKRDCDVKMDVNPAYGCDVKMDTNPAYQVTN